MLSDTMWRIWVTFALSLMAILSIPHRSYAADVAYLPEDTTVVDEYPTEGGTDEEAQPAADWQPTVDEQPTVSEYPTEGGQLGEEGQPKADEEFPAEGDRPLVLDKPTTNYDVHQYSEPIEYTDGIYRLVEDISAIRQSFDVFLYLVIPLAVAVFVVFKFCKFFSDSFIAL